jgi:hypothetical protein
MKTTLGFVCLLLCVGAYASLPRYLDVRAYVEKHNPKDQTIATNRVFIEYEWKDSAIVPYKGEMKLDQVIKQSKLNSNAVFVFVLRGTQQELVYDSRFSKVKASDFVIQRLDAIHMTDMGIN